VRIASEISGRGLSLFEFRTPVIRDTVTVTRDPAFQPVKCFFIFFSNISKQAFIAVKPLATASEPEVTNLYVADI